MFRVFFNSLGDSSVICCPFLRILHTNLLVNSPCLVSPPERRGPGSPSASPPSRSSSWEWAETGRRTRQTCWSSGSTQSNAASCATVLRTGLWEEKGRSCEMLKGTRGTEPRPLPYLLLCCHLSLSAFSTWQLLPLISYGKKWKSNTFTHTK